MAAEEHEVVIVGGGIAGLATALALKRVGVEALVLERSHELRATGAALGLFNNAWRALDVLGVAHKLTSVYDEIKTGRVTNLVTGVTQEMSMKDREGRGIRAVHRKALLEALAEELPPHTIRFSSKLASIRSEVKDNSSEVTALCLEDGAIIKAKVLIGCDGVHSVVAQWLGLKAPIDSGRSAIRGLAVFPEGHGFKLEARQFLEGNKRAGFLPLNSTDVYWFIVYYTTQRDREMVRDPKLILGEVMENLAESYPPEYLNVVAHSDLATLSWAPLMLRVPWNIILGPTYKGCVAVAGDAFHPMTPDIGQGGCSALEDAVVLARNIGLARVEARLMSDGIEKYVMERKWRVAGLVVAAYVSGWVQQGGPVEASWGSQVVKFIRNSFFYRFAFPRIVDFISYDCGALPSMIME